MHPQTLQLKDGVLHKQDLEEPKKEGDEKTRLEELEHEVFKYKKMVERGVEVNRRIISDLIDDHRKETGLLWEKVNLLQKETSHLQALIYDLQNQKCEYELRFKRMSFAASFGTLENTPSFVDGNPLPCKFGNKEEEEEGSSNNQA